MKALIIALAFALACTACGDRDYVYTPHTANAVSAGLPASRTEIPQEAPQGAVEVTSYGITELQAGNTKIPALHMRMTVTNDGDDTPWQLDTRQQQVFIAGEGRSAPVYVNGDVQGLPNVAVARHQRRTLDLYYSLPMTVNDEDDLRGFELHWQVQTPARAVASRTTFDRVERVPQVAYGATAPWPLWAGWGPYWWHDPFYSRVIYAHPRPAIISHSHRGPVRVGTFRGGFRPSRPPPRR